jgi:hypothetical protein
MMASITTLAICRFFIPRLKRSKLPAAFALLMTRSCCSPFGIYTRLNSFEVWIKQYYNDKWDEEKWEMRLELEGKPMYNFYMSNGLNDGIEENMIHNSEIFSKKLKELITEIEAMP